MDKLQKKEMEKLCYRDKNGHMSRNTNRYGDILERMYPVLEPSFSKEEQIKKNLTWFTDFKKKEKPKFPLCDLNYEELVQKIPFSMKFIPSRKMYAKLFKRATQIKDLLSDLNEKNIKHSDEKINALRVRFPKEITYPCMEHDGLKFYCSIGCGQLEYKYCEDDIDGQCKQHHKNMSSNADMIDLWQKGYIMTTERLTAKFIDKIYFRMETVFSRREFKSHFQKKLSIKSLGIKLKEIKRVTHFSK